MLFPKKCLNCGEEGDWLCFDCQKLIKPDYFHFCPICWRQNADGRVCFNCAGKSYLDGLWAVFNYGNKAIQETIHLLKYNFVIDLAEVSANLIKEYLLGIGWQQDFILLPVPLHRRRFLQRGFNQSELICQALAKKTGNAVAPPILKRIIYRGPQTKLKAEHRLKNVRGNFKIDEKKAVGFSPAGRLVLVDDVYTTGATMQECAKILKEQGFKDIWGLAVARG